MNLFSLCAELRYHMTICTASVYLRSLLRPRLIQLQPRGRPGHISLCLRVLRKDNKQGKETLKSIRIQSTTGKQQTGVKLIACDEMSWPGCHSVCAIKVKSRLTPQAQHFTAKHYNGTNPLKTSKWLTNSKACDSKRTLGWGHLTGKLTARLNLTCRPIQLNASPIRGASSRAHTQSLEIFVSI